MEAVKLAIPARPEFVGVVRLAVTSLARNLGLDENRVDDLKIAVSEACTNAMGASDNAGTGGEISVGWSASSEGATVEISGPGLLAEQPDDLDATAPRHSFSNDLLTALLDGYETGSTAEGSVVRLTVNLA